MGQVRLERIDQQGLLLSVTDRDGDVVLDVLMDDRRIWSFWVLRDTEAGLGHGRRRVDWPPPLRPYLDGVTELALVEHVSTRVVHRAEHAFGTSSDRVAVVNGAGRPLGLDKSGRMAQTFDTRSAEHVGPLLDAVEQVLEALDRAGVDAFLAYGSLLGAVREGHLIGHDSDADLGYVSRHTDPVDVVRESFELQRRLTGMGYPIHRYSGAAFRIDVEEADGSVRGLDLFGGFLDAGMLFLMGEVGSPFLPEWLRPLGRATLEGRSLPVPARPERLLEAMYGADWRVPDPAYKFTTPVPVQRALNGWFRGTRVHRQEYGAQFVEQRRDPLPAGSTLAAYLLERETAHGGPGRVVDVGAGRGGDSLWLARQGLEVTAYDYLPSAAGPAAATARAEGQVLEVDTVNLLELRSVLATGTVEARRPGPRTLLARHLADCTTASGRDALWRFCAMALRPGGRLYLEHWVRGGGGPEYVGQRRLATERVTAELVSHGARIVHTAQYDVPQARDTAAGTPGRTIGRVVAQWQD